MQSMFATRRLRAVGLAMLLLGSGVTLADESASPGRKCVGHPDYSMVDILDPETPAAAKQVELEKLKQNAIDPTCHESHYLLGHLLRHGRDIPGNLLAKDTAEARRLIEAYALQGNAIGFADLAELAIAEKQGREAIKWTQVYLYLVARTDERLSDMAHSGYNGDLLLRTQEAARKARVQGRAEAAKAELNAYLAEHRDALLGNRRQWNDEVVAVAAGLASKAGTDDIGLRVRKREKPGYVDFGRLKPGYAVYVMEVQPDGRVSRIVPTAFAPTPEHGKRLRKLVEDWEFYPHRGERATLIRVPVEYGYVDGPRLKTPQG